MLDRRRFLTALTAAGAITILGACDEMPKQAIAPWAGPAPDTIDPRIRALSWALLAPNPHNLQSWQADLRQPGLIALHVDQTRLLPETDPHGRQILIGIGAFLEFLVIAASWEGQRTEVLLFPEGEFSSNALDRRPVAHIKFIADPNVARDGLFNEIPKRRSSKVLYETGRQLPPEAIAELRSAATAPGLAVGFTGNKEEAAIVSAIASEGYRVEFNTPAKLEESLRVVRIGAEAIAAEPSGVTLHGPLFWWGTRVGFITMDAMRDPGSAGFKSMINDRAAQMQATPTWCWIESAGNDRLTHVATGRAYARLDLTAAKLGVAIHPNSQVLQEFSEMAELHERIHKTLKVAAPGRIQMLARLGYAPVQEPKPRRAASQFILS